MDYSIITHFINMKWTMTNAQNVVYVRKSAI